MESIKVIVVEPMEAPVVREIPATLESYQKIVGGYIECIYPFKDPVGLICNDEGKLLNLLPNRSLKTGRRVYDIIAGTFIVVGLGGEDFVSLTDEQIRKYMAMYAEPEFIAICDWEEVFR